MKKYLAFLLVVLSLTASAQTVFTRAGVINWRESSAQQNPPSGQIYMYFDSSTGLLVCKNSTGADVCAAGGGGGSVTSVGLTINGGSSSGIFALTNTPITTTGNIAIATTGTSGGIPYFSTTAVLSSSGALTANHIVLGGGAGAAPTVSTATIVAGALTVTSCAGCDNYPQTVGGTVTSGGVLYASSTTQISSSGALASGQFVLGGGAGSAPTTSFSIVPIANGGTNAATAAAGFNNLSPLTTAGDILYGGTAGAGTRLAAGTATQVLHSGTTPSWGAVTLTTDVTGALPLVNGGTGTAAASAAAAFDALSPTTTQGDIILRGASSNARLGIGTNGQCLTSNGTTAVWGACATGSVGAGSGLTTGVVPVASASFTLADSILSASATAVTISGSGGLFLSAANAPIELTEGTAPTGSAGHAWIYDDAVLHRILFKANSNTVQEPAIFADKLSVFAATSSAELAGVISDESGTGLLVYNNGPTLIAPVLGVATGTSFNGLTLSSLATGFSIAGGTTSRTLTVDATVSTSALAPLASPTFTGTVTGTFSGNLTGNVTGNADTATTAAAWTTARNLAGNSVNGSANVAFSNKFIVQGTTDAGLSGAQFLGALATGIVKNTTTTGVLSIAVAGDFPTLNQDTTGSAAKWTTARNLAGNSVDGSTNVAFSNKFIVQGTTDTGLSGAQFLGALSTGLVKNTTTTGVLSIAAAADVYGLWSGTCNSSTYLNGAGACATPSGTISGLTAGRITVSASATTVTDYAGATLDSSGNATLNSVSTPSDGVHAALIGFGGNTTLPTLTANTFSFIGPSIGTFTAFGWQFPSAENATAGVLHVAAAATHVSALSISAVALSDMATQAGDTVLMNASGSTASPAAVAMPTSGTNGCAGATNALSYNTTTHAWGCNTISATGTVNSGTAGHLGYYASSTNAISDMGADFTFDGTHTLTSGASAIADFTAMTGSNFKTPASITLTTPNIGVANGTSLAATGQLSSSYAGTASNAALTLIGNAYTAGTGTTNFPQLYIKNGASGPTTWSTAGTQFGINATSGFTGNLMDFHINGGASVAKLDYQGNLTVANITGAGSATMGANGGTSGSVVLNGSTSGSATITVGATGILTLPSGATATNMALTTPSLGVATATSINKVAITGPATSATLTIADGKTLTATNTMDVAKTAGVANSGIPYYDTTTSQSVDDLTFSALTDGATVTWAIGSVPMQNKSLTFTTHGGNRTLNITNPVNGGSYVVWLKQDATGGEGLILGTGCTWKVSGGGSGAVTLSTGANAIDVLAFTYDGTNCYANFNKNFN